MKSGENLSAGINNDNPNFETASDRIRKSPPLKQVAQHPVVNMLISITRKNQDKHLCSLLYSVNSTGVILCSIECDL